VLAVTIDFDDLTLGRLDDAWIVVVSAECIEEQNT
jgi:hypothetical protein